MKTIYLKSKHGSFAKIAIEDDESIRPVCVVNSGPDSMVIQTMNSGDNIRWSDRMVKNAGYGVSCRDEFEGILYKAMAQISEQTKE